jgi:hypothetical protein
MERDEYADMFQFHMRQQVRWAEDPDSCYVIAQRRWTQREILAPFVEYRLRLRFASDTLGGTMSLWVLESALEACPEQGRSYDTRTTL